MLTFKLSSSLHSCLMSRFTLVNESTLSFPRLVLRNWLILKNMENCKAHIPFSNSRGEFFHFCHVVGSNVVLKIREKKQSIIVISRAIIGDGDRKRGPFLVAVPIIWRNFSIFRTNCAITCGTRAYMMRGFCGCLGP